MTATTLNLLSAGAAMGLVQTLQPAFEQASGARLQARFGAVGAMKEALLAGEPCDLFIVTDKMIDELVGAGALQAAPRAALGRVHTGVAVREADPAPAIGTPEALRLALRAASAIHYPDPQRATAGIHFQRVLAELGLDSELAPRCRTFPNGATAMRELATAAPGAIGCTQVSEILCTRGVRLLGKLPPAFELATVYSAALAQRAAQPALAERFMLWLAGADRQALRQAAGFEA